MRREGQEIRVYTEFWWEDLMGMNLLTDRERDEGIRRKQVVRLGDARSWLQIVSNNGFCG
jgi:hypothetical protein